MKKTNYQIYILVALLTISVSYNIHLSSKNDGVSSEKIIIPCGDDGGAMKLMSQSSSRDDSKKKKNNESMSTSDDGVQQRPQQQEAPPTVPSNTHPPNTATEQPPPPLQLTYVIILSLQRSSSTFLSHEILGHQPCHVSLNEILNSNEIDYAWDTAGAELGITPEICRKTKVCTGELMATFVRKGAEYRCRRQMRNHPNDQCNNRCTVNWKQFINHMTPEKKHIDFWMALQNQIKNNQHESAVAIRLERPVEDRWKSNYIAETTGDWDVKGSAEHKAKIEEMKRQNKIPPVDDNFRKIHEKWYDMVDSAFFHQNNNNNSSIIMFPMMETTFVSITSKPINDTRAEVDEFISKHLSSLQH